MASATSLRACAMSPSVRAASSGRRSRESAPASDRYTIDVDGTMREYILAVPDDYDPARPYRLIFGWHPLGGSAQQVASGGYYGLEGQANGEAIFVAAEGLPFQGNNLGWANTNGRDLAFWFEASNVWGCHAWDSAFGANFHIRIE